MQMSDQVSKNQAPKFYRISKSKSDRFYDMGFDVIYFIVEEDDPLEGPCKIGITHHLSKRLTQIQNGNSRKLRFIDFLFIPTTKIRMESHSLGFNYWTANYAARKNVNRVIRENTEDNWRFNLEGAIHSKLKELGYHLRGEWFSGGYHKIMEIVGEVVAVQAPDMKICDIKEASKRCKLIMVDVGKAADN